jgi:cysteine desulfurase
VLETPLRQLAEGWEGLNLRLISNNKKMKVYLDNAATTAMDKEVISAMISVMEYNFGNRSSVHSFGISRRGVIEKARKKVASYINAVPAEIFFT